MNSNVALINIIHPSFYEYCFFWFGFDILQVVFSIFCPPSFHFPSLHYIIFLNIPLFDSAEQQFSMSRISLILYFCLLHLALSLTLQGQWRLTQIGPLNLSVPVSIKQLVLNQPQIINEVTFFSCNQLKYQFNIDQNNIWIDTSSQSTHHSSDCSDADAVLSQNIKKAIRSVFKFQIEAEKLTLYDTSQNPLMVFLREANSKIQNSILGSWITNFLIDDASTYLVIADESSINICNTVFTYSIQPPYSISFTLQSAPACQNTQIVPTVLQSTFFKKHNGKLQLYDSSVALLGEARYRSNQNSVPQASAPVAPSSPTSFGPGNYILLLLFRRDLGRTKVQVTSQSIRMTLCTQLTFSYTLIQPKQISIKATSTPDPACKKVDETIYYNYLTSATSYTIDEDGVITLNDNSNTSIVSLAP